MLILMLPNRENCWWNAAAVDVWKGNKEAGQNWWRWGTTIDCEGHVNGEWVGFDNCWFSTMWTTMWTPMWTTMRTTMWTEGWFPTIALSLSPCCHVAFLLYCYFITYWCQQTCTFQTLESDTVSLENDVNKERLWRVKRHHNKDAFQKVQSHPVSIWESTKRESTTGCQTRQTWHDVGKIFPQVGMQVCADECAGFCRPMHNVLFVQLFVRGNIGLPCSWYRGIIKFPCIYTGIGA